MQLCLLALLWGCDGSDPEERDAGARTEMDAGPGTEMDAGANVDAGEVAGDAGGAVCLGCVTPTGACIDSPTDEMCGSGGAPCESCIGAEVCAEGVCTAPPGCGPDNCDGCCDEFDDCVIGLAENACGGDGLSCQVCSPEETCDGTLCELDCSPETCDGCCEGNECISGTSDTQCGVSGEACVDCTFVGADLTCFLFGDDSFCSVSTECDCPDGCCLPGGECLAGTASEACGASGGACEDCAAFGGTCGGAGSCEFDPAPDERFLVRVIAATVPLRNGADTWDFFGGLPDPVVFLGVGAESCPRPDRCAFDVAQDLTDVEDNDITPLFLDTLFGPSGVRIADLRDGITVRFFDQDTTGRQLMRECLLTPPLDAFRDDRRAQTLTCGDYELRYDIERP